jgi:hypothetical protein
MPAFDLKNARRNRTVGCRHRLSAFPAIKPNESTTATPSKRLDRIAKRGHQSSRKVLVLPEDVSVTASPWAPHTKQWKWSRPGAAWYKWSEGLWSVWNGHSASRGRVGRLSSCNPRRCATLTMSARSMICATSSFLPPEVRANRLFLQSVRRPSTLRKC